MKRLLLSVVLVLVLATRGWGVELPIIPSDMELSGLGFDACSNNVPYVVSIYSKSKTTGIIELSTLDGVDVAQLWYEGSEFKRIIVKRGAEVKSYKTSDEFLADYPEGLCWIIENYGAQAS